MIMKRDKIKLIILLFVSALIRLPFLGSLPPGGVNSFVLRLPTALTSIATIGLFYALIQRLSKKHLLAFYSALFLSLMPWHIEQSRIISPPMIGLGVILVLALSLTFTKTKIIKLICIGIAVGLFYIVYPAFWLFHLPYQFPEAGHYIDNIFKLVSFEFLFFKNDAFWSGGIREYGVMLPAAIPLFITGGLVILSRIKWQDFKLVLPYILVLLIASASPLFPEEREYFLATPYFAIVLGMGAFTIHKYFRKSHLILKAAAVLLILMLAYEYSVFTHYYIVHYAQRISNEIPQESRTF